MSILRLWILLCLMSAVLVGCEPSAVSTKTYEDCVLAVSQKAQSDQSMEVAKRACKLKFPKKFDFEAIARKASVDSWEKVTTKPEFSTLPADAKSAAQEQYWSEVVLPAVPSDFVQEARADFEAYARRVLKGASQPAQ